MSPAASAAFERDIAGKIAAAGLRLRFDKVALRVVARLKDTIAARARADETVMFTLTAPIRLPSKTVEAVEDLLRDGLPDHDIRAQVHGNQLQVRRVAGVARDRPRAIGFVHNLESDAGLILDLARASLLDQDKPGGS